MKPRSTVLLALALLTTTVGGWWAGGAQGLESRFFKLYDVSDSRGPVTRIGYAFYPASKELRVRVIVGRRIEAWGIYQDDNSIDHMLRIIQRDTDGLFAVFEDSRLIALYRE